jgi:4-alpha-glucanotransferase
MAQPEQVPAPKTPLAQLARHFGIEPGFRDARGEDVVTSPQTQTALLGSMGIEAGSEAQAKAALDRAERAAGETVLPPVIVTRHRKGQCAVTAQLPTGAARIAWRVTLEDGGERSGAAEAVPTGGAKAARPGVGPRHMQIVLEDVPEGYHRLHLPEFHASTALIVVPERCWLPEGIETGGKGLWGIAAQLYLLRSDRNWGIGDFTDLAALARMAGPRGCGVIGLNPLHQMFLDAPEQASPYSPLTRLYLNALNIDVSAIPGFSGSAEAQRLVGSGEFQQMLDEVRAASLVQYSRVADLKMQALRLLFAEFDSQPAASKTAFTTFSEERGENLQRNSVFQALRQHFGREDPAKADWHTWPDELQDAASEAVRAFAEEHRHEIAFLNWLQWIADEQLRAAAEAASEAGMAIGLYRDLAVGCDRAGAETWTSPHAFLDGPQVGAPPDIFNPAGQSWGLPPFNPSALKEEAYASFVELVRANMRHAGGLRIDHVMGLQHLYCIPEGHSAAEGAYVEYPIDDLVGILALESQRHRCLVVGEDLGTVPEGFRETMAAANILSYRVVFFEQDSETGEFRPPEDYPRLALAVAGSHDLPTLLGWWDRRDIDLKASLGLYPDEAETQSQRDRRTRDRTMMLKALRREGIIKSDGAVSGEAFAAAAHRYLARSGSALVVPQLDDMTGEVDPVNVPATSTEHPNWRRKYRMTLEEITSREEPWAVAQTLATERGGAAASGAEQDAKARTVGRPTEGNV